MRGRRPGAAEGDVTAGEEAYCLFRSSGQGRGRTADLPFFRLAAAVWRLEPAGVGVALPARLALASWHSRLPGH